MDHSHQLIINGVAKTVEKHLAGKGPSHDWYHVNRVWQLSKKIAEEEGADLFVVELAALLHDIADWKTYGGDETIGPKIARNLLIEYALSKPIVDHVCKIIVATGAAGDTAQSGINTLEGKVVQDADWLDAIGAIGVARCFAYSGEHGQTFHDPTISPQEKLTKENAILTSSSINHFREKLLKLKEKMHTKTAMEMAEDKHQFMTRFVEEFLKEWDECL